MSRHECIGECDCCGQGDRHLRHVWAYGMETWACAKCRDADLDEEAEAASQDESLRFGP